MIDINKTLNRTAICVPGLRSCAKRRGKRFVNPFANPIVAPPTTMRHNVVMSRDLFRFDAPNSVPGWLAVDDRVMGGVSASSLRYDLAGHAVFEGCVSLENNGGFASVRLRPLACTPSAATYYLLEVCGDGKHYKLSLRMNARSDAVSYQASFEPPQGVWSLLRVPIAAFIATFRGRRVTHAPPLDPAAVAQVSLVIAGGQAGPFRLAIRSLGTE